ncbi:MAG: helix-turn-helix domain-containing protein [Candidatus Stygibacter australis]|nr:helix-turn-helix domain-containing protein [Candidatus Stygibacter australis]MDP8320873.1 helix-turn-helix domain-containing protein [Candidatus Stygibacter australis]
MRRLLNSQEAAELLGLSVSKLYKLTMTRQIPHKKVFGRLRFDEQVLEEWLEGNIIEVTTSDELNSKAEGLLEGNHG